MSLNFTFSEDGAKPDPLVIIDPDSGKLLFAIRKDGSVEGTGADANKAAQIFADAFRVMVPEVFSK